MFYLSNYKFANYELGILIPIPVTELPITLLSYSLSTHLSVLNSHNSPLIFHPGSAMHLPVLFDEFEIQFHVLAGDMKRGYLQTFVYP